MAEYDNTNKGALFSNSARKTTDKHPDWTGNINVGGVEYWISGWERVGQPGTKIDGQTFYSLAVTRKDEQSKEAPRANTQARAPARPTAPPKRDDMDDEIPF